MATLTLRINIVEKNVTKMVQFLPSTLVVDACAIIRDKNSEATNGEGKDYGLFLSTEDRKEGVWLEPSRNLGYYMLRNTDLLEYKRKFRTLRVRMLDGTIKTILVDDSQPVANMMVVICTKIGITNHDEYSLVRENQDEEQENKPNFGTLTLRRKKEEKEKDAKMEQLKKKLRTEDEVNWIDPSKTLREQGIDENETVLLRRKFFFSDQNIDSRDPVQLNLLYVQARDAILDGTHPVTQEKACEFAGIQAQIQYGDYIESKHKPGFLELREFLPASYIKVKNIEKKIFAEHKKHQGNTELEAKVIYTKNARSLKTYGVAFFLVKEKMKGKNKLVPRLLGVTKDSVLRLDEKTKEILKTWPLTTVRRWGASPNTFTLDFGDYSDEYYSVQTTEAEQIQQLIAGYIDIILRKKQAKDHCGIEGDEGSTMVEDSVCPSKATILQHEKSKVSKVNTESLAKPAVMRAAADGARTYGTGHMGAAQYMTVSGQVHLAHAPSTMQKSKVSNVMSEPHRALLSTISAGHEIIVTAEKELITKVTIPRLGTDPASLKWKETTLDTNKQNVSSQIAAMNAATAQVVTLTSGGDEVDHTAVGAAITTIASNLPEMTKGVRLIAALMDDTGNGGGEKLLDAARKLCNAFSDLLKAAEPETKEPRQALLTAASKVGEASHGVLTTIGEETEDNREVQDILLGLAKAVANTTAALVLKAKNIAASCEDADTQNRVISAATQCALATSQLVACSKVVAPTLSSAACQQQLMVAVREVAQAVEELDEVCNAACSDQFKLGELNQAAGHVTHTLNQLLNHIKSASRDGATDSLQESAVETIMVTTDKLLASSDDSAEMVRQARVLGQATAQLIQAIKGEAEVEPNSEMQRKLLEAAKVLADATTKMVEAARQCASNPNDAQRQDNLRRTVEDLRLATTHAATPAYKKSVLHKLETAAKEAAAASIQCMTAAQNAGHTNQSRSTQDELLTNCRTLADALPKLAESVKATLASPESPTAQLNLLSAADHFILPGTRVVQSSRAVVPTVTDQAAAMQLSSSSQQLGSSLNELRVALDRGRDVFADGQVDTLSHVFDIICGLKAELEDFERAVLANELRPLPGETADNAAQVLATTSNNVRLAMAQLQSAASQQNSAYTKHAAQEIASSLKDLTMGVRAVASTTGDKQLQSRIIQSAEIVMDRSLMLINDAKSALLSPQAASNLHTSCKGVTNAMSNCVNCLPGQRDVDEVIANIDDASQILILNEFPSTDKTYSELQNELHAAAEGLGRASSGVVSGVGNTLRLAETTKQYGNCFNDVLVVAMEMAGQTKDMETREQVIISLKNMTIVSSNLLNTAKAVAANPNAPNSKNQLTSAARAVTDSINYLLDVCTSATPGQKECDSAVRSIQSMRPLLDSTSDPVNEFSYFECLDAVMCNSKSLGDGMTGIANHAKKCEHEKFGHAVKGVAVAICGLVEAAAQASYLVGISDSSSIAGRPGLLDQSQLARAYQSIQSACNDLVNPSCNQQKVLYAATEIAKHTSLLCSACRVASSKTANPVAKRHFVQSAKDVANSTANLVKEIKTLDLNYTESNRQNACDATKPLLEAVEGLCTFSSSSEFASVPARISLAARSSQEPITSAGHSIINGSCSMIEAAKSLAVSPKDPPTWQLLANHSKSVSDSIKKLVSSIRDKAPGQKECDDALDRLQKLTQQLDQAVLTGFSQSEPNRRNHSLQQFTDTVQSSANEIGDRLSPLTQAAKFQAENVGHCVNQFVHFFEPLVQSAIGAASNMVHSKPQMLLLDQTKTLAECASQLICNTKEGGGNPKAVNIHGEIDESVEATREALQDLNVTLEHLANQAGIINGQLDLITRAMSRVSDNRSSSMATDEIYSFVDYQTRMVTSAKEIARLAQDMVTKSASNVQKLGQLSAEISKTYSQLACDSVGAASSTNNADVSMRIKSGIQLLGNACIEVVKAGNNCQIAPAGDTYAQRDLSEAAKHVSERVSQILAALQAGSRGTQACINAASTVSGIIGDLDTTIMFATAGTLHAEKENETFADHRENILKTAKALVEDTKTLVAGAASTQEQLAVAAQNAVTTIVQLAEVVKFGAASLGSNNPEAQVMLMNSVKDVATALGDLIHATKTASGKGIDHPSMNHLKDSAKVMVTNVTSLLKTVKAVEDEHTRGTRALEATIEAIAQEIRALHSPEAFKSAAGPEDLVRCSKPITTATAKAVAAGNSGKQDDAIVAANVGRKAVSDMLTICKGVANNAETQELRTRTLNCGQDVAVQYRELLQVILHVLSKPGQTEHKAQLPAVSRKIAQCVTDLVACAQLLKGSEWVDPDDPTVIAENELLGAAASIDAAAKKLASLRPRRSVQETDENLNFDEMILEAAKSIAAATSALVKAASAAQRELIDLGKMSRRPLTSSDDGQWSEGLISAARLVAAATHSLVEAANALVQGVTSEEKMVSAAKQVASSTAQLLVACKVKADPDADSTKRLQSAGNAVKRATDNLVRAAQRAILQDEERSVILNTRMVGGMAQEINARSEVLRIERQLEEARGRLNAIRQAKYKLKGHDSDGDGDEGDAYNSGYDSLLARSVDTSPSLGYNANSGHQQPHYSDLISPEKVSDADADARNIHKSPAALSNSPAKFLPAFSSFAVIDKCPNELATSDHASKQNFMSSFSHTESNQNAVNGTQTHVTTVTSQKNFIENRSFATRSSQQNMTTFRP